MKKNLIVVTTLAFAFGCSRGTMPIEAGTDAVSDPLTEIINRPTTAAIKKVFKCGFEPMNAIFLGGVRTKFSHELVESVLTELEGKENIEDFWTYLTLPTKQELIYELSLSLAPEKKSSLLPYRAAAVFFGELARNTDRNKAFHFKGEGMNYTFSVAGEKISTSMALDLRCAEKYLNLSTINIPTDIKFASMISEVYHCETLNDSFKVIRLGDSTYIASHMDIVEVNNSQVRRKESPTEISFDLDSAQIEFKMKFYKNQMYAIKGNMGHRTRINIKSPTLDVNTSASCTLITNL